MRPLTVARHGHYRRWLALHGVPQDRLQQASSRVVEALLGVHRDPRGRWILRSGYRSDLREHALSGHAGGELVRVVFDRSFIDDAGVRWVIDYKTSQHLGGGLEEFLDREVERYRPQLQRSGLLARRLGPRTGAAGAVLSVDAGRLAESGKRKRGLTSRAPIARACRLIVADRGLSDSVSQIGSSPLLRILQCENWSF